MEEVEVLDLTSQEYNDLNNLYKISLYNDGVPFPIVKTANINKMVLNNGIYRKEFHIAVNDETAKDRVKRLKETEEFLKKLNSEFSDDEGVKFFEHVYNKSKK